MQLLASVRHALPRGQTLPEQAWRRRHHALALLLWAHALGLPAFAVLRGFGVTHSLIEGLGPAFFGILALTARRYHRVAAACVSFGLVTSSAMLVHIWGGVIEFDGTGYPDGLGGKEIPLVPGSSSCATRSTR